MQPSDVVSCKPSRRNLRGVGVAYVGSGTAFLAAALLGEQPAFTGVGCALIGLGIVWIARSRGGR